jgi:hypothetical protein
MARPIAISYISKEDNMARTLRRAQVAPKITRRITHIDASVQRSLDQQEFEMAMKEVARELSAARSRVLHLITEFTKRK